jgi:CBS domain-containing protein
MKEGGAMKTVNEIVLAKANKLLSIAPEASVLDALKLMAEREVGALVVLEGEKLAGIFSERDYARKVVLQGKSSKDTPVSEIMTRKVVCVRPDQSVEDCMALMTDKRIRHLPVLQGERVIGVISIGDVVKHRVKEIEQESSALRDYIQTA